MNKIEAIRQKSEYALEEHLVIVVDGKPLDHIISEFDKNEEYALFGLVPSLLNWLDSKEEERVAWERILPLNGQKTMAPILMCPDDCDFWCTVIVAEIEVRDKAVTWKRIGIDSGKTGGKPETIGNKVDWLPISELSFELGDYKLMLSEFKKEFEAA